MKRFKIKYEYIVGMVFGIGICSCAGVAPSFNYAYYGLAAASYDGKLLAVNPANDKNLSICAPDANVKGKCILMVGPEFYAMKKDFLDKSQKLIDCQKNSTQN